MIGQGLGARVAVGLGAAAVILGAAATAAWLLGEHTTAVAAEPAVAPPSGSRSPQVLTALEGPGAWLVYLARSPASLPPAVAPVVALERDGRLRLLRPPPPASGPAPEPWLAAGVVLPAAGLADASPAERVALLDLCGVFGGTRGLRPDQVVAIDLQLRPGELERLLHWLR